MSSNEPTGFRTYFYESGYAFLNGLLKSAAEAQLPLRKNWDIDHICYRTASVETYQNVCRDIATFSELLIESDVNGRPIATFKLKEAFTVEGHVIDVVEVPAPKGAVSFEDGFEHVEIVIDIPFAELKQELLEAGLTYAESPKAFNTEVKVSLPNGNVKFHQLSLESVIRLEKSTAFPALRDSKVLETLAGFAPLVAGTFPLGLETGTSDLDIIVVLNEAEQLESVLRQAYGHFPQFILDRNRANALFCRFLFGGIPIEVYGEPASERPRAYHHFLIEERILKLMKPEFRQRVLELRSQGSKTEPAFAAALELSGDPYESLLALQTLSLAELSAVVQRS